MPSGTLCSPMTIAMTMPPRESTACWAEVAKDAPMTIPSGHVVQGNGRRHYQSGQEQAAMVLAPLLMDLVVVCVNQLFQRVCRLGVTLIDVGHFMVGIPVNPGVSR